MTKSELIERLADKMNHLSSKDVEVAVKEEQSIPLAEAIVQAAQTGNRGDGKVFILPVDKAYRISSGKEGDESLQ